MSARRLWLAAALAASSVTLAGQAAGDLPDLSHTLALDQVIAVSVDEDAGGVTQGRVRVGSETRVRFEGGWEARLGLRVEVAGSDTGLGSTATYDDLSRPLTLGPDARVEIDEAVLAWRKRSTRVTLGKQTWAWGVLDGLQVTDRLDPARRREAVFINQRPDRLSRWGARAQFTRAGVRWDSALVIDGTADQFALPGETYAVTAPRLRAGLPVGAPLPDLRVETSGAVTAGLKAERGFGAADAGLLVIHGPDPEAVFRPDATGVRLTYDTRNLIGATWQRSAGPRVWRVEAAWVPDQPLNVSRNGIAVDDRQRWLAGGGVDWNLKGDTFLNAQLGIDHVAGDDLFRPETDVIATVKLRRGFSNERWIASAEVLGSLSDGDATFRPAMAWQASDRLRLEGGADLVWGKQDSLIGQFDRTDRLWLRARFTR